MWPDSEHSWNYVIVIDPSLWNLLPRTSSINFCASFLEQYFLDTRRILMWLLEHTNQCSDIPSKLLLSFFHWTICAILLHYSYLDFTLVFHVMGVYVYLCVQYTYELTVMLGVWKKCYRVRVPFLQMSLFIYKYVDDV